MFWLARQLKRMRKEAMPSAAFKAALLERLVGHPAPRHTFRFAAVGIACAVLLFGSGTSVYAYESSDVTEGHPLYFVKQKIEQVEGALATTPEARAQFHEKMFLRRMAEVERTQEAVPPHVDRVLEQAATEFEQAAGELPSIPTKQRPAMLKRLTDQNERYQQVFDRHAPPPNAPPPARLRNRLQMMNPNPEQNVLP